MQHGEQTGAIGLGAGQEQVQFLLGKPRFTYAYLTAPPFFKGTITLSGLSSSNRSSLSVSGIAAGVDAFRRRDRI